MLKKIAKLMDVKSIVTFALTGVFAYLAIAKYVKPEQFTTIYTTVIAFYFGTQHQKNEQRKEIDDGEDKGET